VKRLESFLIKYSIVLSIAFFFFLRISLSPLIGPTVCKDGSYSPSIGIQGACSWHGGVAINWSAILVNLFSFIVALILWSILEGRKQKLKKYYLKS
jgi:hypothetical protein